MFCCWWPEDCTQRNWTREGPQGPYVNGRLIRGWDPPQGTGPALPQVFRIHSLTYVGPAQCWELWEQHQTQKSLLFWPLCVGNGMEPGKSSSEALRGTSGFLWWNQRPLRQVGTSKRRLVILISLGKDFSSGILRTTLWMIWSKSVCQASASKPRHELLSSPGRGRKRSVGKFWVVPFVYREVSPTNFSPRLGYPTCSHNAPGPRAGQPPRPAPSRQISRDGSEFLSPRKCKEALPPWAQGTFWELLKADRSWFFLLEAPLESFHL